MLIIFFDAGPVLIGLAVVFLALVGALESALPVLTVIIWVVFGLFCLFAMVIPFSEDTIGIRVGRRVINVIVYAGTLTMLGFALADFLSSITAAANLTGVEGLFEFIFEVLFGIIGMMIVSTGLVGALGWLCSEDSNCPWGIRLVVAIAANIAYLVIC